MELVCLMVYLSFKSRPCRAQEDLGLLSSRFAEFAVVGEQHFHPATRATTFSRSVSMCPQSDGPPCWQEQVERSNPDAAPEAAEGIVVA